MLSLTCSGLRSRSCATTPGRSSGTARRSRISAAAGRRRQPRAVKLNDALRRRQLSAGAPTRSRLLLEAAAIAKALSSTAAGQVPVKAGLGARDDIAARATTGRCTTTRSRQGMDAQGEVTAWRHTIVGQSILAGTAFEPMMVKNGWMRPRSRARRTCPTRSPTGWSSCIRRRSASGAMVAARSAHAHRVRHRMLPRRHRACVRQGSGRPAPEPLPTILGTRACSSSQQTGGWGKPLGKDRSRGVAVHESFGTFVAQVVELRGASRRRAHRARVCAVDCGVAVNPNIVGDADGVGHRLWLFGGLAREPSR